MAEPAPKSIGELSLCKLLSSLDVLLAPETYVFLTLPPQTNPPADPVVQMLFREREGLSVITTKQSAIEHNLSYTFPCRMIALNVHSSLEAVGFIAAIAEVLTKLGVGVNPVSGYYHDHIFVPEGKESVVMNVLGELRQRARSKLESSLPQLEDVA